MSHLSPTLYSQLKQTGLSGAARMLFLELLHLSNEEHQVHTNAGMLAGELESHPQYIRRNLKVLRGQGMIATATSNGHYKTTITIAPTWRKKQADPLPPASPPPTVPMPHPRATIHVSPEPSIGEPPIQAAPARPAPSAHVSRQHAPPRRIGNYRTMTWPEFWDAAGQGSWRRSRFGLDHKKLCALEEAHTPKDLQADILDGIASGRIRQPISLVLGQIQIQDDGAPIFSPDLIQLRPVKSEQTQSPGKPAEPLDIAPPEDAAAMFENVRSLLRGA